MTRRLLTIGHSYVVALNRRLADALARAGAGTWEVTAAAPAFMHGDLRPIPLEPLPGEACRVEPVSVHNSKRPRFLVYGRRLRQLLREPWDLVHVWQEPYTPAGAQCAWWTPRRTPLVFATFQNLPKRFPPPFNWLERRSMNRAAGYIAFGHTAQEVLRDRPGYVGKPCRVIPPGVDTERFRPDPAARAAVRQALGWTDDGPPVVGFLGRFVPEKGLSLLTGVLDRLTGWRAMLVGGGPHEGELRAWAAQHGDAVRIVTGVTHDRVPEHLNAMDMLAAPSQTLANWREQFGRMLTEAFACGLAVIGSDSGEIPHVIGNAGVVVGEADVAGWERAVGALIADAGQRAELGRRGRERAEAEFAWPTVARRHLDFFGEILGKMER